MAQVRSTYLHSSGQQVNMGDTDTLRAELDPTLENDVVNKRYSDTEDLRIASEAQAANDSLETRINEEIARLDLEDVYLHSRLDQEISDRIAGDNAILDLINGGSTDSGNKYVERDGDDMLGDLTFATDKITLGIDGNGSFAGDVSANTFNSDTVSGQYNLFGNQGIASNLNTAFANASGTEVIQLYNSGSASFAATVSCNIISAGKGNFNADKSQTGNIITVNDGDAATITNTGNATFGGHLEAASCDGGTY
jgi:hypothetical protein